MGAKIPIAVKETELSLYLLRKMMMLTYRGKTRDMYALLKNFLIVATDRISIFDFVLNALIPYKGEVLTAMVHFWLNTVLKDFPNHLVFSNKYPSQNAAMDLLSQFPSLDLKRSLVVKAVDILPYEFIFRHHLGGSVFKGYQRTGTAGGQKLPPNLPKWSRLMVPLFTPSTKEESGHDENINASSFLDNHGEEGRELVGMLQRAYERVYAFAKERGILVLDTKLEADFGIIADEVFTPDSSRFCDEKDWEQAMRDGREPNFLDKQVVRQWGEKIITPFTKEGENITGLKGLDPENKEHVEWVHQLKLPEEIIAETTRRYLEIFERLTGKSLPEYQKFNMGIII